MSDSNDPLLRFLVNVFAIFPSERKSLISALRPQRNNDLRGDENLFDSSIRINMCYPIGI